MRCRLPFFIFLLIFSILWVFFPQSVFAQETTSSPTPLTPASTDALLPSPVVQVLNSISKPENGAVISGTVPIFGTTTGAWVLTFSSAENTVETKFPLAQSGDPVTNQTLTIWDTNNLTDGLYLLQLSNLADEVKQDFVVKVRVSNYTSIETITPTAMLAMTITATLTPMSVPTSVSILQSGPISSESDVAVLTPFPASTEFPLPLVNPATLAPKDIFIYLGKGILAVVVVFVLVSLIFFLRHK